MVDTRHWNASVAIPQLEVDRWTYLLPNTALLTEGGLQLRTGVSPTIPPGIVEADSQEANTNQTDLSLLIPMIHPNQMWPSWRKEHLGLLTFVRTRWLLRYPCRYWCLSCWLPVPAVLFATSLACRLPVSDACSILPSPAVRRPSDPSTQEILNKLSLLGQKPMSFTNYKLICFQTFGSGLALTDSSRLLTSSPTSPQSSDQTDDPADIQYQLH